MPLENADGKIRGCGSCGVSVCIFHTLGMSPLLSQVSEKKKKKLHQGNDTLGEISNGK